MKKKSYLEEQISYGIDQFNKKKITVELRDLLYIYKTIEELRRFFHQRSHYTQLEDIYNYIGNNKSGMYSILSNIYLKIFTKMFGEKIIKLVEDDKFYQEQSPYYYKKKVKISSLKKKNNVKEQKK